MYSVGNIVLVFPDISTYSRKEIMESQRLKALFISDTHLAPHYPERLTQLLKSIETEKPDKLYLLGDIFDRWAGWDNYPEFTAKIQQEFKIIAKNCEIFFMTGNHDRLIKPHDMPLLSATWLSDPSIITLGKNRIYLTHGDKLCTQDRLLRWFTPFHDAHITNYLFLKLPLKFRRKVVTSSKTISKQNRKTFDLNTIELDLKLVARELRENHADFVIHGHTHRPQHHKNPERYTLGSWEENPVYLRFLDGNFSYESLHRHAATANTSSIIE